MHQPAPSDLELKPRRAALAPTAPPVSRRPSSRPSILAEAERVRLRQLAVAQVVAHPRLPRLLILRHAPEHVGHHAQPRRQPAALLDSNPSPPCSRANEAREYDVCSRSRLGLRDGPESVRSLVFLARVSPAAHRRRARRRAGGRGATGSRRASRESRAPRRWRPVGAASLRGRSPTAAQPRASRREGRAAAGRLRPAGSRTATLRDGCTDFVVEGARTGESQRKGVWARRRLSASRGLGVLLGANAQTQRGVPGGGLGCSLRASLCASSRA